MKARVPFYLRNHDNSTRWELGMSVAGVMASNTRVYNHLGCRVLCTACGWFKRERHLKIRFHDDILRGFEMCPRCSCLKLKFFDDLSPAQESLLAD